MIRQMTEVEIAQKELEMDLFWKNLDWNTKNDIMRLLEPYIERAECEHDWVDPNEYENELDKKMLFCRKCYIKKPIWYEQKTV